MLNSTHKTNRSRKNDDKDEKALYKLRWKNNGKLQEENRCKTCKQQKRLIKMDIQTKLYVIQNI